MSAPFNRTILWILVTIGALSLAGAILLGVFAGELGTQRSTGADGYSRSALGHALLIETLERAGLPVMQSRHDSGARALSGVLVIAEPIVPEDDEAAAATLREMVAAASTVVLVLPKWHGSPDPVRPGWVADVDLLPVEEVTPVLRALGIEGTLERSAAPETRAASLPAPQAIGFSSLEEPRNIDAGTLIGTLEIEDTEVVVISDPDLLNNHGLGRGKNVELVVELLRELAGDGPIVFDETLHGFRLEPSPFRALFTPPLLFATVAALLASLLLVWAAVSRFGPPLPAAPALALGKDELIRNTAALMRFGGHDAQALRRYFTHALQTVRLALHRPRLEAPELEDEVNQTARLGRVSARRILHTARRIHRWREELLHGHRADPRHG